MGSITVTSAILLITAWTVLIEFDSYSEEKRRGIIEKIKSSPLYWVIIAFLPLGIVINGIGAMVGSGLFLLLGASFIVLQSLIIAAFLWNVTRWKSMMLFIIIIGLGLVLYIPLIQ